jgi:hypothetical protein
LAIILLKTLALYQWEVVEEALDSNVPPERSHLKKLESPDCTLFGSEYGEFIEEYLQAIIGNTYIYLYVYVYLYVYIYTYIHLYIYVYVYIYMYVSHTYICIYIYIYIHKCFVYITGNRREQKYLLTQFVGGGIEELTISEELLTSYQKAFMGLDQQCRGFLEVFMNILIYMFNKIYYLYIYTYIYNLITSMCYPYNIFLY